MLTLAIPTVISQLITVVYNMADMFFIGNLNDPLQVAAATIAMPCFMLLTGFANLFGLGGSSLISRCLGTGDQEKARHCASFCIWTGAAVALLYGIAVVLLEPVLFPILGASADTWEYCRQYAFWTIGKKVQPLCLSLLRKGSLDVVFMLILNGAVGVSGIAWATPFADWIAFVISVALIVPQLKRPRTD